MLDKLTLYAGGAVLAVAIATGTYYVWKRGVEQAALASYNQRQLEQSIRDQAEFMKRQEEVAEQGRRAAAELAEQGRRLQSRVNSIGQMIGQSQDDSPAADVVKRTIERLRQEAQR